MIIQTSFTDIDGNAVEIGDTVEFFDWGSKRESIGVAVIVFDEDEGRVSTDPCLVYYAYDFWSKCRSRNCKIIKKGTTK